MLTPAAIEAMGYTTRTAVDGLPMYYLEGKRIKKSMVPEDVLEYFGSVEPQTPTNSEIQTAAPQRAEKQTDIPQTEVLPQARTCVFCNNPADSARFVNGRVINLCHDDYQTKTTGQIVQRQRELDESTEQISSRPIPQDTTEGSTIPDSGSQPIADSTEHLIS